MVAIVPLANGLNSFSITITDVQGSSMTCLVNFAGNVNVILPVKLQGFDAVRVMQMR